MVRRPQNMSFSNVKHASEIANYLVDIQRRRMPYERARTRPWGGGTGETKTRATRENPRRGVAGITAERCKIAHTPCLRPLAQLRIEAFG